MYGSFLLHAGPCSMLLEPCVQDPARRMFAAFIASAVCAKPQNSEFEKAYAFTGQHRPLTALASVCSVWLRRHKRFAGELDEEDVYASRETTGYPDIFCDAYARIVSPLLDRRGQDTGRVEWKPTSRGAQAQCLPYGGIGAPTGYPLQSWHARPRRRLK